MDYPDYAFIDFVLDDDFFGWVMQPDAATDQFWMEWLVEHPHKRAEVEQARKQILALSTQIGKSERKEMPEKAQLWEKIRDEIERKSTPSND